MYYLLKQFLPPILKSLKNYSFKYGWKGNYKSFEAAQKYCKGYDEDHILKKISLTTTKVKTGEIAYERDGVMYDEMQINTNVLSKLLQISAENDNKLTLVDFGGSLGTSFYQNIPFLKHLKELNWCIIEQEHYVREGKSLFENEQLKFYHSIDECMKDHSDVNLLMISNTLQYIKSPYTLLRELQVLKIPYLLMDYVGYNNRNKDRLTIQYVPPFFYGIDASYPCMFFNRSKLEDQLGKNYKKVSEFISDSDTYYLGLLPFKYEGSFWKLRES